MELPGSVKEFASVCHSTSSTKTLPKGSSSHISECLSLRIKRQQLLYNQQTEEVICSSRRWFNIHQNAASQPLQCASPSKSCLESLIFLQCRFLHDDCHKLSEREWNFSAMLWMATVKNWWFCVKKNQVKQLAENGKTNEVTKLGVNSWNTSKLLKGEVKPGWNFT